MRWARPPSTSSASSTTATPAWAREPFLPSSSSLVALCSLQKVGDFNLELRGSNPFAGF
jgi:hypothetical protein